MIFKKLLIKKYREHLKKFKQMQEEILKKERTKYTSIFQHDIKTPILAQKQSLDLFLQEKFGKINQAQREILEDLYMSNNFLLETIANSIFISKYENEPRQLKLEKINIIEQTKDCIDIMKTFAEEKQQNIVLEYNHNHDIKLNADRRLIKKIIFNLLSSSISSGIENSEIKISVEEKQDTISFYTKNKSVYMTKEKINSLFEEKKNLRDFNQLGMNLNLNIAKKLIDAHNWGIIAESDKDNSSTFGFIVRK